MTSYRQYDDEEMRRARFFKPAQALGFSRNKSTRRILDIFLS